MHVQVKGLEAQLRGWRVCICIVYIYIYIYIYMYMYR
mgnify:CR=1 FL=1